MIISKVLEQIEDIKYEVINEREVMALGLCDYGPDESYCCFISSEKYLQNVKNNAVLVITKRELADQIVAMGKGVIIVDHPKEIFFRVHDKLCQLDTYQRPYYSMEIGKDCKISPTAIISKDNVKIGNNVFIDDYVVIKSNVTINDNVNIRAGSIIGGQNYQLYRKNGIVKCAIHVGGVVIRSNADIGYNVTIGKGLYPWDDTIVGENTVIADLSALGHGCKVGNRSFVCVSAVINGRTIIGDDVWVGPRAVVSNGLHVEDGGFVSIGSVAIRNVKEGEKVFGNPARAMFIE